MWGGGYKRVFLGKVEKKKTNTVIVVTEKKSSVAKKKIDLSCERLYKRRMLNRIKNEAQSSENGK
jgi:hypothetical protein